MTKPAGVRQRAPAFFTFSIGLFYDMMSKYFKKNITIRTYLIVFALGLHQKRPKRTLYSLQ